MVPAEPATGSAASSLPNSTHTDTITFDKTPDHVQDTVNAATNSSDAPGSTLHHTAVDTSDEPRITSKTDAAMKAKWSTMNIDEKLATIDTRNKAFAAQSRKPEGQSKPTPEPGPVHEDDHELFKKLDKRMAALRVEVGNFGNSFREIKNGSDETGDS